MLNERIRTIGICTSIFFVFGICAFLFSGCASVASRDAGKPLILAEDGTSRYSIVIGKDADYGEDLAAKELSHFLKEITGADFAVNSDDAPVSDFEIVLGNTNRMTMDEIPESLKTDNWEGFAILRQGAKLYIMGNIPRGTLYGVYDFLDIELGVRFLTAEATHIPKKSTLKIAFKSRMYAPPIERRTIWEGLGGAAMMRRNRLNGTGFAVLDNKLGGVKVIGPVTHTFSKLVPVEKYFDEHPEYFSEINGKRRRTYDGIWTQLCMTNPEVAQVALKTIRGFLGPAVKASPYNKYIVSVTVNDSSNFCKCTKCVAVNKEEGVDEGGTLMRFVNTIATQLKSEYPGVSVETMVYGTTLPKKTRPVSNVIMQMVHTPNLRYALDDPSSQRNREMMVKFRRWKETIGEGGLYNWLCLGSYGSSSYLDPRPNLKYLAESMRIMNDYGITGFFCQTVQSRGTEMQDLRFYLIARVLWRPELDGRETIEEFCRLYYGKAAKDVLRYIDFLHDDYGPKDEIGTTFGINTEAYDDNFIKKSDAILARAEAKAETPEIRQRVATCRLPIWKLKLDRAFGEVGKVFSFPVEWSFKIDPQDKGIKEQWQNTASFDGWRSMRIDKPWTKQGEDRRGVAWYGIKFDMPDTKNAPLALWFGAIDGDADIFIDSEKVGEQKLPASTMWSHGFFIPLKALTPGAHKIVIRVFKPNYNAGIWKAISIVDMSVPISEELRTAGERFVKVGRAVDLAVISESYAPRYTQTEKMYYPKVEFFLKHGRMK